jgi:5-methylthioribose kinase
MAHYALDERTAAEYLCDRGLFPRDARLVVREIGDGNINMVFHVRQEGDGRSMIVKQALPFVRCVGESWPLSLERVRIEADSMELADEYAPGLVPKLFHRNDAMALIVMEDLSHMGVMRGGMLRMRKYPEFAGHISTFMANLLFYTSDLAMDPVEKKALVARFINPDLCKITEDLIFTDPYHDSERNRVNPALRPYLEKAFWKKDRLRLEASKLKYKFLTEAQSLIHGDLHTGSIFADEHETRVFDSEFAFVGPSAFDVGLLIGELFINYCSWSGKPEPAARIADYRAYLREMIDGLYGQFEEKFRGNWETGAKDAIAGVPGYQDAYMRRLFADTVGYAGLVMIRRMHGLAHDIDVDEIQDEELRKEVQIRILETAEELVLRREEFTSIGDVIRLVQARAD